MTVLKLCCLVPLWKTPTDNLGKCIYLWAKL